MKIIIYLFLISTAFHCSTAQSQRESDVKKVVLDPSDEEYGYYLSVEPKGQVEAALILLPGFGQKPEDVFLDTEFHNYAREENILTIAFAGRMRLTADSILTEKLNLVLTDVLEKVDIARDRIVLGGFSAGGVIALRYTELCHQYPNDYPVKPSAVFMADSPVDLFHSWKMQEENVKNNYSDISVNEANYLKRFYHDYYGSTPSENPEKYVDLSPFSIDKNYGNNEQYLEKVAVRAYHDIDVAWRLVNRNQTARFDNYIATSELINRLMLMGNSKAEFIQTFKTGIRRNGQRHPHSWSIMDEEECIQWIKKVLRQS